MQVKIICFVLITIAVSIPISKASKNARRRSAIRLFKEKSMLMEFLNSTGRILKKKNSTDPTVDNWLHYFQKDLRSAFAVGTVYLRLIKKYNLNITTKLTPDENLQIRDAFITLVNDYRNHDSYALWMGDNQGGTATAAIFKFVGGDPLALLGPPNNPNDVMSEIIYPTENPHSSGNAIVRGSFKCSGTPTGENSLNNDEDKWTKSEIAKMIHSSSYTEEEKITFIWIKMKALQDFSASQKEIITSQKQTIISQNQTITSQNQIITNLQKDLAKKNRIHTVLFLRRKLEVYKQPWYRPADFKSAEKWKNLSAKDRWSKLFSYVKNLPDTDILHRFVAVKKLYTFLADKKGTDIADLAETIEKFMEKLHLAIHNYQEDGYLDTTFLLEDPVYHSLSRYIYYDFKSVLPETTTTRGEGEDNRDIFEEV